MRKKDFVPLPTPVKAVKELRKLLSARSSDTINLLILQSYAHHLNRVRIYSAGSYKLGRLTDLPPFDPLLPYARRKKREEEEKAVSDAGRTKKARRSKSVGPVGRRAVKELNAPRKDSTPCNSEDYEDDVSSAPVIAKFSLRLRKKNTTAIDVAIESDADSSSGDDGGDDDDEKRPRSPKRTKTRGQSSPPVSVSTHLLEGLRYKFFCEISAEIAHVAVRSRRRLHCLQRSATRPRARRLLSQKASTPTMMMRCPRESCANWTAGCLLARSATSTAAPARGSLRQVIRHQTRHTTLATPKLLARRSGDRFASRTVKSMATSWTRWHGCSTRAAFRVAWCCTTQTRG